MVSSAACQPQGPLDETEEQAGQRRKRKELLVRQHFAFVWRVARRLGLAPQDAEDTAQRVLITAANRIDDLIPGKERAFLFRVTSYEAARWRRARSRRREDIQSDMDTEYATSDDPEQLLDQRRARAQLDAILARMTRQLREVFVLYEIEGFATREIAAALGISDGTVASRLRRARQQFTRAAVQQGVLRPPKGGK